VNDRTQAAADDRPIKKDLLASVVVFLVALPLCMGIAIASGVPVAAGLVTGIVGGLVLGWIAGCPLQVSGPAAGLTVIVVDLVQRLGLEMLGLAVLLAGLMQVLAGSLRLGQWFRAVSPAVIKGMLAGIGFLILGSQFHVMIDDKPRGNGAENLAAIPESLAKSVSLPEWSSNSARRARIRALHEVGELHRRQVGLQERLAEFAPHETEPALDAPTPDIPQPIWESLTGQQAAITNQLEDLFQRLDELGEPGSSNDRVARARSEAEIALDESRNALAGLQSADFTAAHEAQREAVASFESLIGALKNHHLAAYLGVLTIATIVLWQSAAPRKLRVLPAPLLAVVGATAAAAIWAMPVLYVEVPANLADDLRIPTMAVMSNAPWAGVLQVAVMLAVVASAETLLCANAVDRLHNGPRTKYDQELVAQGIGNTICGLLGALPMTGVIVRSSANVQAGARTRLSAVLHGLWLLIFVAGLAFVLRAIPTASLAAVLVYTGYKLIDVKALTELRQFGWSEIAIYAATVSTIVFTDLLTGVLTGVALSAIKLLLTFSRLHVTLDIHRPSNKAVLQLEGAATFLRLPKLAAALEDVPPNCELHVDLEDLSYIDHACLDLLHNWSRQHEDTGGVLMLDWERLTQQREPRRSGRVVRAVK